MHWMHWSDYRQGALRQRLCSPLAGGWAKCNTNLQMHFLAPEEQGHHDLQWHDRRLSPWFIILTSLVIISGNQRTKLPPHTWSQRSINTLVWYYKKCSKTFSLTITFSEMGILYLTQHPPQSQTPKNWDWERKISGGLKTSLRLSLWV